MQDRREPAGYHGLVFLSEQEMRSGRSFVPCSFRRTRMAYTEFRMTLLVEVKPDVERELAAQAACRGMDVTAYAASLLEQAARGRRPGRPSRTSAGKPSPNS